MKEKQIENGQFPTYTFRIDPKIVKEFEKLKGKGSWNQLFKEFLKLYEPPKPN